MLPYEPGLGQLIFGNAYGELDLGENESYVAEMLKELSKILGEDEWAYGNNFRNDVFEMRPYWWGDCDCGVVTWRDDNGHASDCPIVAPNFKCGDLEIRWYKYIGRGMSVNREVSREELREIFRRCRQSVNK